ncbi:MAG: FtsX-like permease family protein [Calditrichaeota bacterium]|nr:FtsX-like permease family protein [Calditrichota bacterium]
MNIFTLFGEFIRDLRAQKLRTFLTVFGIIWGTVAIIVLLAFGNGFQKQTMKTMNGIGEAIVLVFPGQTSKPYMGMGTERWIRLREEDAYLIEREIPYIKSASPEYSTWEAPLRVENRVRSPNVTGVVPVYSEMRNIIPQAGSRFIDEIDQKLRRRVVFLGNDLAAYLFQGKNPVGEYVFVGRTPFRVIGVMKEKEQDSSYNSRDKDRAFIPASTFKALFGHRYVNDIVFSTVHPTVSPLAIDEVYKILGKKYRFDPTDKEALSVWDTNEFQKMVWYIFLGLNIFMAIIGAFTLTVGGIGVANIMYVVVQERTREIGIKRSIGAKKRHILGQFFLETFFIIFIGALIGALISLGIIFIISVLPLEQFVGKPSVSWWVALTAVSILGFIGFIAGLFPAKKAANLNVIECLRF